MMEPLKNCKMDKKGRKVLSEDKKTAEVKKQSNAYFPDVIDEITAAIEKDSVVVIGMSANGYVRKVRKALDEAKIEHRYLEYGGYVSQWDKRLVIKMWSGWPTFPQVFVKGILIGGCDDTTKALKDGTFETLLTSGKGSHADDSHVSLDD